MGKSKKEKYGQHTDYNFIFANTAHCIGLFYFTDGISGIISDTVNGEIQPVRPDH